MNEIPILFFHLFSSPTTKHHTTIATIPYRHRRILSHWRWRCHPHGWPSPFLSSLFLESSSSPTPPLSGTPAYLLCFSSMTSTPQERRRKKQEPATTASPSPPLQPPSPPPVTATSSLFFSFTTVPKSHRKPHLRLPPRATWQKPISAKPKPHPSQSTTIHDNKKSNKSNPQTEKRKKTEHRKQEPQPQWPSSLFLCHDREPPPWPPCPSLAASTTTITISKATAKSHQKPPLVVAKPTANHHRLTLRHP